MPRVAKMAGVHRTTVAKAFKKGWPGLGLPPILEVIKVDQEAARAILSDKIREHEEKKAEVEAKRAKIVDLEAMTAAVELDREQAAEARRIQAVVDDELRRQKARAQAAEDRAEEAKGVRVFRRNTIALGGMVAKLSRDMLRLPDAFTEALEKEIRDGKLTSKAALQLMRTAARVNKETAEAMASVVKLNRLLLGEPGEIIGVQGTGELTPEEAASWIRRASTALERQEKFAEWGDLKLVHDADADAEEPDTATG